MRRFGGSIMFRRGDLVWGGPAEGLDPTKSRPYLILSDPWVVPMDYASSMKLVPISTRHNSMLDIPIICSQKLDADNTSVPISFIKCCGIKSARYCDVVSFKYIGCIDPDVVDLVARVENEQIHGTRESYQKVYDEIQRYIGGFIKYYNLPENIFELDKRPVGGTVTMDNRQYTISNEGHLPSEPLMNEKFINDPKEIVTEDADPFKLEPVKLVPVDHQPKPDTLKTGSGKKIFINNKPQQNTTRGTAVAKVHISNSFRKADSADMEEDSIYTKRVIESNKSFEQFQEEMPYRASGWTDEQLIDFMRTIRQINNDESFKIYEIRYGKNRATSSSIRNRWNTVAKVMEERGLDSLVIPLNHLRCSNKNAVAVNN